MVLANVSTRTLAKIATYGAVATIGSLIWARSHLQNRVRKAEFYKEAMRTLRTNPGAVSMLGEPIVEHGFDVTDSENNSCDQTSAHFQVSVKGPKDKGYMFFWAERPGEQEKWLISRMELALKNSPDKRLVIKKEIF